MSQHPSSGILKTVPAASGTGHTTCTATPLQRCLIGTATVCRYLFTAKLLYMFRMSQHPSSGILKTVPAASGTGHTTCTATPLQRCLIGTATVCRYLFTAKLLYMFRVSHHPSLGVLKTVNAASGTGHNTGVATSLQRGLIETCRVALQ